jgi:two-component sensor histidine kinase
MDTDEGGSLFLAVEPEIETALKAGGVGIWRWRIGSAELGWSQNLEAIHRLPPGTFDGTFESFSDDIDPTDLARVMKTIDYSIATGHPYEIRYRNRPPNGIEPIWIEARGEIVSRPDGERYMTGVCQDATDRITGQMELVRRLTQQQAVSGLGTFALAQDSFDAVIKRAVDVVADVLMVPLVAVMELNATADSLLVRAGKGWDLVGQTSVVLQPESQAGYALRQGKAVISEDVAGDKRFVASPILAYHNVKSGLSAVIAGDDDRPFGVLCVYTTQSRRFDAADADFLTSVSNIVATSARHAHISQRRQIIIREMAHRSGNLLQLVQSIFNQTVASTDSEHAAEVFRARLGTLAKANFLLAEDGWTQTRMRKLIETTLGAFSDRAEMSGPDLLLPADLAFDLSLVLHELAANSAKYGSLAGTEHSVKITWETEPQGEATILTINWLDKSTSNPMDRPKGTGFGTKLIKMLVERKWAGGLTSDDSDGYRFSLSLPIPNRQGVESAEVA